MTDPFVKTKFAVPVDRDDVARDWAARGFSCALFVDSPGQEWNNFVHGCNELVSVAEGRLEMTVGDRTEILEEGDEVFIPNEVVHSVKNIHSGTSRWYYGYD